jgi:tetratricopeptide (TPR) repeat protein
MRLGVIALAAACLAPLTGCELFRSLSRPKEAQPVQVSEPTPEQAERLEEAEAAKEAGNLGDALSMFQDILAENPTITTAYLGIGDIYMLQEDYESAEPAYARAARLEPRNYEAQYGHGVALQMLKRYAESIRAYHRALTIDPDSPDANLNLANVYVELREPTRALTFAEKAVEMAPDRGPARSTLGSIYQELGRNDEAIETFLVAIELMGNHPPLMMNLIQSLARESRFREALNTAQTLVRLDPTANAYERLGWCAFKLRDYEQSIEAYRDAVDIEPGHWQSLNGIGVNALNKWLLSKKRDDDARHEAGDAFRRSLRANPRQPKVIQLLDNYRL